MVSVTAGMVAMANMKVTEQDTAPVTEVGTVPATEGGTVPATEVDTVPATELDMVPLDTEAMANTRNMAMEPLTPKACMAVTEAMVLAMEVMAMGTEDCPMDMAAMAEDTENMMSTKAPDTEDTAAATAEATVILMEDVSRTGCI